jgi:hypothetical protein
MKAVKKISCLKVLVMALLVLWQSDVLAQDEYPADTTYATDTSVYEELESVEVTPPRQRIDTVIFRSVPDSVIIKLRSEKEFEYASDPSYWVKEPPPVEDEGSSWSLLSQKWFEVLMIILMAGVLLFAIVKIAIPYRCR